MIEPPNAVAYRCDDLGMRMAEHRAHLAGGKVQYAPASSIVEKRALGANRHEIDEFAPIFQQVTASAFPKLRVARNDTLVHHPSPLLKRARDTTAPHNSVQFGAGSSLIAKRSYSAAMARVNSLTASASV